MPRENEQKLKEMILYISQRCEGDRKFGATKLNKILFFSDFLFYASTGSSITGAEYQRLTNGPAPKRLVPVRAAMVENQDLEYFAVPLFSGKTQHRTRAKRNPDLSLFTAEEIATVNAVIAGLDGQTADQVSDLSHKLVSWIVAGHGEIIPYNTIFVSNAPLDEVEIHRGYQIARQLGVTIH